MYSAHAATLRACTPCSDPTLACPRQPVSVAVLGARGSRAGPGAAWSPGLRLALALRPSATARPGSPSVDLPARRGVGRVWQCADRPGASVAPPYINANRAAGAARAGRGGAGGPHLAASALILPRSRRGHRRPCAARPQPGLSETAHCTAVCLPDCDISQRCTVRPVQRCIIDRTRCRAPRPSGPAGPHPPPGPKAEVGLGFEEVDFR